jgi:transposase
MTKILVEDEVVVVGAVGNVGELASSTLSTAQGKGGGTLAPGQRWSVGRKREVVLRLLRGESVDLVSRELGVEIYRLEAWRDKALSGIDTALKERGGDPLKADLDQAMMRIGELTMEVELLRARTERPGPLARTRSRP